MAKKWKLWFTHSNNVLLQHSTKIMLWSKNLVSRRLLAVSRCWLSVLRNVWPGHSGICYLLQHSPVPQNNWCSPLWCSLPFVLWFNKCSMALLLFGRYVGCKISLLRLAPEGGKRKKALRSTDLWDSPPSYCEKVAANGKWGCESRKGPAKRERVVAVR